MKQKKKLVSLICAFCLVICLGVFGVLAVTELNLAIGGEIKFSATGVKATISDGRFVTGDDTANLTDYAGVWQVPSDVDTKLKGFDITTKQATYNDEIAKWSGLKLQFNEAGDSVYLYFTIQNKNNDGSKLEVTFTSDVPSEGKNNVKIEFTEIGNISTGDPIAVFVKFSIVNKLLDANLTSFSLNFNLKRTINAVVDENGVISNITSTEYTGVKYSVYEGTATATANGNPAGDIIILNKISQDGIIYPVTDIKNSAFSGQKSITSITIPDSVTSIWHAAFSGCTGLTSIHIPKSVSFISDEVFVNCTGLESITVADDNENYYSSGNCLIEKSSKCLIVGCKNSVIPTDVTSIYSSAFDGCTGLTSITIPDSIKSINMYAFQGCTGLTSITIPEGVTGIWYAAFSGCTSLSEVTVLAEEPPELGADAFSNISSNAIFYVPNDLYLTDGDWKDLNLVVSNS